MICSIIIRKEHFGVGIHIEILNSINMVFMQMRDEERIYVRVRVKIFFPSPHLYGRYAPTIIYYTKSPWSTTNLFHKKGSMTNRNQMSCKINNHSPLSFMPLQLPIQGWFGKKVSRASTMYTKSVGVLLSLVPRMEALALPYLSERATPKPTHWYINNTITRSQ